MRFTYILLTLLSCTFFLTAQMMVGGYTPQDPEAEDMKPVAMKVIQMLEAKHSGLKVKKIRKMATQVVAGMNYAFTFEVEQSSNASLWEVQVYEDFSGNISLTKANKIRDLISTIELPKLPKDYTALDANDFATMMLEYRLLTQAKVQNKDAELVKSHHIARHKQQESKAYLLTELRQNGKIIFWQVWGEKNDKSWHVEVKPLKISHNYPEFHLIGGTDNLVVGQQIEIYCRIIPAVNKARGRYENSTYLAAVAMTPEKGGVSASSIHQVVKKLIAKPISQVYLRAPKKGQAPERTMLGMGEVTIQGGGYFNNYVVQDKEGRSLLFCDVILE